MRENVRLLKTYMGLLPIRDGQPLWTKALFKQSGLGFWESEKTYFEISRDGS